MPRVLRPFALHSIPYKPRLYADKGALDALNRQVDKVRPQLQIERLVPTFHQYGNPYCTCACTVLDISRTVPHTNPHVWSRLTCLEVYWASA